MFIYLILYLNKILYNYSYYTWLTNHESSTGADVEAAKTVVIPG